MGKKAKLIPVYKVDDQLERSNYRPISILAVISKVLSKVLTLIIYCRPTNMA